ncbi:MAG: CDP-6-deoxy-delta-3,4-glucoseen reductase [Zoogloeaceae bacterium]|jgi:CDP-4-dehydro-6-deoxyglucose reductase|nr:CDP-6-deoxy-delta-3,4-glucoseen reductase [Zoogloeaceae bacterium]
MSHQITIKPSGATFTADADETLLDAALRQGILLPHGCRHGACGACKGGVLSGTVDHGKYQPHALTDAEREAGKTLFCCAHAQSDLTIDCPKATTKADDALKVKTMPVRIERLEKVTKDVILMHLRLPASETLEFRAGQYIDFLLPEGQRRSFSIANAPGKQDFIELHIRHVSGGLFTSWLFETAKVKDILRIEGPHGSFFLRDDNKKPIILLATGTGFAPIKGIVEDSLARKSKHPLHLYWGNRHESGFYARALPEQWVKKHSHIRFTPVLFAPSHDWHGRVGQVEEVAAADYPDLSGFEVYACGNPGMVEAAHHTLTTRCGLPEDAFYADAFAFAAAPEQ